MAENLCLVPVDEHFIGAIPALLKFKEQFRGRPGKELLGKAGVAVIWREVHIGWVRLNGVAGQRRSHSEGCGDDGPNPFNGFYEHRVRAVPRSTGPNNPSSDGQA